MKGAEGAVFLLEVLISISDTGYVVNFDFFLLPQVSLFARLFPG